MRMESATVYDHRVRRRSKDRRHVVRLLFLLALFGLGAVFGAFLQANAMNQGAADIAGAAAEAGAGFGEADPPAAAADLAKRNAPASLVCVAPGDTLWSIAKQYAPEGVSTKTYVQQIIEANSMTSAALRAGDVLILP